MVAAASAPDFVPTAHRKYIKRVSEDSQAYEYAVSEHLRMSGMCAERERKRGEVVAQFTCAAARIAATGRRLR